MNPQEYLEHVAGMASLMEWTYTHQKAGYDIEQTEDSVIIDPVLSSKFLLGIPKSKKWGKYPFLAAQKREAIFLRLMRIGRACVRAGKPELHLAIPSLSGDGANYPDIPAFCLSFMLDHPQKVDIIAAAGRIDLRGFWFDEAGNIEVGSRQVIWNVPLLRIGANDPILLPSDRSDGPSFKDLIKIKIDSTNVYADPGTWR